jgi:hypothetical protein
MLRGLHVPITVAVLAATLAACGPGPTQPTSQPASTQPTAAGSAPAASTSPGHDATHPTSAAPGGPPGTTGISGRTVIVSCPVDRGDPPCPATPVPARLEILDAGTQAVVTTVDTDAQGAFTAQVPAGSYVLRVVRVGTAPARRPQSMPVTVTSGHYTTITMRVDNGLR